jgi:catechol 2,3-dioxygenase-like lactoylglutathione lyase family enzyme
MSNVRYLVRDVAEATRFYVDRLGFEPVERWGDAFAILRRNDLRLWLAGPGTSAARSMPDGRRPGPGGWNRFVLQVDGIDEWAARLKTADVSFRSDVLKGPGGSQLLIEDPSGNPIELFEPRET